MARSWTQLVGFVLNATSVKDLIELEFSSFQKS